MENFQMIEAAIKYPCREQILTELDDLLGNPSESVPNAVHVFGHTGTGKSVIINEFLKSLGIKYKIINCIECYTSKLLFEHVLNTFYCHIVSRSNNYAPYVKCDSMHTFIENLRGLPLDEPFIVCLDNAERLRDMDLNILPTFLRLQEITGLNICTILISQLPFEKFYLKTGLVEIQTVYFPQYSKVEVQTILANDFANVKEFLKQKLSDAYMAVLLDTLESDFYDNYLNVFLNVFYRACRDLPELKVISRDCFQLYVEPVLNGTIDCGDLGKLWRNISKPLSTALAAVYMRVDTTMDSSPSNKVLDEIQCTKRLAQTLELPFYTKFLLIAAYLASHNAAKQDKRLFVKDHGKQKKRLQTINAQAKVTEKMQTNLGPKSFTIDRLLAIFYAILDEKVGLNCNLLSQISSLLHLKFLSFVSGESNIIEGSARLQCTVGLDFVLHIGRVVGFNVAQYLCDFM